jgi:hypothetical protein
VPIGAIAGGISSIVGGIMGSNASSNAAAQEQAAYGNAENYQKQNANLAIGQQQATTGQIGNELAPYTAAGTQGVNSLASMLAPGGSLTQGYGSFAAPTAAQAEQQPGYQFQLTQGLNALQNSAAARGGLLSTGNAKNIENYAQGLASTNYNNAYNQALQGYQTNASTFYNNQNNLYNRLAGLTNTGLSATGQLTGLQQSGANALTNIYQGTGQEVGQEMIGAGQAQAAGTVGSSNALTSGIAGGINALGGGLGSLMGVQNASAPMAGVPANSLSYGYNQKNLPTSGGYYQ